MAKRLKIAVIGTGFVRRVHFEQLQRVEGVDVVAVAGRELASARKIAAGYGVQATDDYRKLLQDSSVDFGHSLVLESAYAVYRRIYPAMKFILN
jgi:predicted dehydrogenase